MNNTLIFLRHAETKKEENIPVSKWVLTEEGKNKSEDLSKTGIFDDVDIIISSTEVKAYQTAEPFAKRLNKKIIQVKELSELSRDKGKTMTKEDYDKMKIKIFEDLDYTDFYWETSNHALNRFKKAVEKINKRYENKKILIVAHGTVMTLYFAYLQNKLNDLFSRWKGLDFCGYGVVKNNKVVKDIT